MNFFFLFPALAISSEFILFLLIILDSHSPIRDFLESLVIFCCLFIFKSGQQSEAPSVPGVVWQVGICWMVSSSGDLGSSCLFSGAEQRKHCWGCDRGDCSPPNGSVHRFSPKLSLRCKLHPSLCDWYFLIQSLSGLVYPGIAVPHPNLLSLNKTEVIG